MVEAASRIPGPGACPGRRGGYDNTVSATPTAPQAPEAPVLPDEAPPAPPRPGRYPAVARACVHLNGAFLLFWAAYALGPDALRVLPLDRQGSAYALFSGAFFLLHFVLVSTAIIALFIVIIEIHAGRPVRGFRSVLLGLALPIASFLYFAARFLAEVERWLRGGTR